MLMWAGTGGAMCQCVVPVSIGAPLAGGVLGKEVVICLGNSWTWAAGFSIVSLLELCHVCWEDALF